MMDDRFRFMAIFNIFRSKLTGMKHLVLISAVGFLVACASKKETPKTMTVTDTTAAYSSDTTRLPANPPADTLRTVSREDMLGNLVLGMTDQQVLLAVGEPASRSKAMEWGADGLMHQDWNYPAKGLVLNFASEKKANSATLFSISAGEKCTLRFPGNIGIGSSYDEVMKQFGDKVDREASSKTSIVVGSVYGGLIFNFHNNKTVKIFVGAAAE